MIISVKLLQFSKAPSPIEIKLLPKIMLVKLLQSEKAYFPIDVTLSGMIISVKLPQPLKACSPIETKLLPKTTFNNSHKEKAQSPIDVTDDGMSISARLMHPLNALLPILVTVFGMMTLVISLFPFNACFGISVVPSGNVATPSVIVCAASVNAVSNKMIRIVNCLSENE